MSVTCEYCGKSVGERSLKRHHSSRTCLDRQGRHIKGNECDWCGENFIRRDCLNRHVVTCKRRIQASSRTVEDQLRIDNSRLTTLLTDRENEVEQLSEENNELRDELKLAKKEISVLKENPTTVHNNNIQVKLRVDKFVVERYAPEHFTSLTDKALREALTITPDYRLLTKGPEAIAKLFLETSLAGNDKLAFTDVPRQKGYYKDRDGQVTEDVKLRRLVPRMIRHIFPGYRDSFMAADLSWDEGMPYRTVLDTLSRLAKGDALNTKYARGLVAFLAEHKNDLDYMLEGKYKEMEEYEDDVD